MILTIQHVNVKSTDAIDRLIEDQILELQPRLVIEEARVRLEKRREESPAYRVAIKIVTPGPDLMLEGADHTLRAAIAKVMNEFDQKLNERSNKRHRTVRGNLQARQFPGRAGGSGAIVR